MKVAAVHHSGSDRPAAIAAAPDHLPGLDGLRACAVFSVILFHAEYFHAGWIGVQVFFVLSGFLITRILLAAKRNSEAGPRGSAREFFCRFYWRRTLRIFPLYFLFLLVLAAAFWLTRWPSRFPGAAPWLFSYTFNFARLAPDWPFTPAFDHLWSLAVEEQFYLLWPAAVWFLPAKKLRRLIIAMIVLAPFLRLGTAQLLTAWTPDRTLLSTGAGIYVLLSSHLDAFGLGAALAAGFPLLTRQPLKKLMVCLAVIIGAGLAVLHSLRSERLSGWSSLGYPLTLAWHHQYVWGYTLVNLAAAWFIALLVAPDAGPGARRWLENPAAAYLGRISYGIYVWHAPVLALTVIVLRVPEYRPPGALGLLAAIVITIGLAAACYHGFESWFLKFKNLRPWAGVHSPSEATR
jgi:peptidoglycan/LPS O-acetylase OafA/YrhL